MQGFRTMQESDKSSLEKESKDSATYFSHELLRCEMHLDWQDSYPAVYPSFSRIELAS